MNQKSKKLIYVFIILFNFIFNCTVYAGCDTCADNRYNSGHFIVHPNKENGEFIMQWQDTKGQVFCLKHGVPAPHGDYVGYKDICSLTTTLIGENIRAAIGYVIGTSNGYSKKQKVIHKLMNDAGIGGAPTSYDTTLYSTAKSIKRLYNVSPTITLGDFSLNGDNYEATYSYDDKGLGTPSVSVNVGSVSNGKVYVPKTTQTTDGKVSVTIKANWSKNYNLAITKICNQDSKEYQPIAESNTISKSKSYSANTTKDLTISYYLDLNGRLDGIDSGNISGYGTADVYINGELVADDVTDYYTKWPYGTTYEIKDIKALTGKRHEGVYSGSLSGTITGDTNVRLEFISLGSFQIHKTASDSKSVVGFPSSTNNFKFGLYSDSSCLTKIGEEEVDAAGNAYFNDRVPGIYYLKEIETKDGYQIDNTIYRIEIKAGSPDPKTDYNYKEIKNFTVCEVEFEKLTDKNNMAQRIGLYRKLKHDYPSANYRNVLNLNMLEAKDACSSVELNYDYEYGCFSTTTYIKDKKTKNSLSISSSNLSMYDDDYYGTYDDSEQGIKLFCTTSFNLENNIGSNFGKIKSGQAIINAEIGVAKGNLIRTCYAYVENYNSDIQNAIKNKLNVDKDNALAFYKDHVNSVEIPDYTTNLDERYELPYEIQNAVTNVENEGILTKIVTTVEANYSLPYMHAYNKDGRIIYSDSETYGSNYKPLGRGIISRLNADPNEYAFSILANLKEKFGSGKESGSNKLCSYTIENELIDNKNNINLEFRSVKTGIDSSFFSKTGSGTRKIGANWIGNENILKDNNDSYNKNNATEAKYSIILTPAIIEKIRDYNKTNKYDDYNFDCKNSGTVCISNYLSNLKDNYGLTINTSNRTKYESIK